MVLRKELGIKAFLMLWQCDCAYFCFGCIVAKWLVLSGGVEWVVRGLIENAVV